MSPKIFNNAETRRFLAIVIAFIGCATLGGLLNYAYAAHQWFYGIIALLDLLLFGVGIWKLVSGGSGDE